jgi:hypothetical protein
MTKLSRWIGLTLTWVAVIGSVAVLPGCKKELEAPFDKGVCWHMVYDANQKVKFNRLAEKVPNMETCAARLEEMRLRFLRLGGNAREVTGAYQGNFIFVKLTGIFMAQTWEGPQYPALVRTEDGRLAIPGAVR